MNGSDADPELEEIHAGTWELRLPIPWREAVVNCFLFADGETVDMIDCGMNADWSLRLVEAAVQEVAGPRGRLRKLVATHIHPDHYGGAGGLVGRNGAELYLHRLEVPLVHPRYLEIEQLVTEVGRFLEVHGVPREEADFLKNASRGIREFVTPADPALELEGSELLKLGRQRVRVEWTPGHSPGHVCLFDLDRGLLFAGDALLPGETPNIGLHPQSTPNPLEDYIHTLARLVELRPQLVLPSHGRPFTAAADRAEVLVEHHARRKNQMLELIGDAEMSAWEIAKSVWGLRPDLHDMRMALQEGLAHLQSLSVEGRLQKLATPAAVTWRRAS